MSRETEIELRKSSSSIVPTLLLDGMEVGAEIRTPAVSDSTSKISTRMEVRRKLVALQRTFAATSGCVAEGRDIGTVVFPDTPYKFFLTASSAIRAERRLGDLDPSGVELDLERVRRELEIRDSRDRNRGASPLTCDDSYQVIDTSELSPESVVETILAAVESR